MVVYLGSEPIFSPKEDNMELQIKLNEKGELVLTEIDESDGEFLLGGTFIPKRTTVVVPKSRFKELSKLILGKKK